ncbi:unnamed protein product [Strongylus vulgaris]|uniref:ADP-ribosylation factor 1-like 2 n=1 Tax=Strongylus vulgaris TaxID=40348 RepID=A0A3P7J0C5_STRVU|nr:unnamed protein product [Strongylus vulgaris]
MYLLPHTNLFYLKILDQSICFMFTKGQLFLGFNVETVDYCNLSFTVWDAGGQQKIRPLWKYYLNSSSKVIFTLVPLNAVIFVVDSADRDRIGEARYEFRALLDEPVLRVKFKGRYRCRLLHNLLYFADAKFLILANKQDLPNAMSRGEVVKGLELYKVKRQKWYVQPSNAVTGEGLVEGLEWLHSVISKD